MYTAYALSLMCGAKQKVARLTTPMHTVTLNMARHWRLFIPKLKMMRPFISALSHRRVDPVLSPQCAGLEEVQYIPITWKTDRNFNFDVKYIEDVYGGENETIPIWIDGTTMNYTDFYQSYTDSTQFEDQCLRINTNNGWHPVDCEYCPIRFLCNNDNTTIRGNSPSPTMPPVAAVRVEYDRWCNVEHSLRCNTSIATEITNGADVAFTIHFVFNGSLQCEYPKLSVAFQDAASLTVYVGDDLIETCHRIPNRPQCDIWTHCLEDESLSIISGPESTEIEVTILKSHQVDAQCGNITLSAEIEILCRDPWLVTHSPSLYPTPAPSGKPTTVPLPVDEERSTTENDHRNGMDSGKDSVARDTTISMIVMAFLLVVVCLGIYKTKTSRSKPSPPKRPVHRKRDPKKADKKKVLVQKEGKRRGRGRDEKKPVNGNDKVIRNEGQQRRVHYAEYVANAGQQPYDQADGHSDPPMAFAVDSGK